jgi:hypothetical protein
LRCWASEWGSCDEIIHIQRGKEVNEIHMTKQVHNIRIIRRAINKDARARVCVCEALPPHPSCLQHSASTQRNVNEALIQERTMSSQHAAYSAIGSILYECFDSISTGVSVRGRVEVDVIYKGLAERLTEGVD